MSRDWKIAIALLLFFLIMNMGYMSKVFLRLNSLENKEVHHLLPKGAKCRIKLMYFRDSKGRMLPPASMQTYKVTPDALCHWEIE